MSLSYEFLFPALWLSWGAYWLISSRQVKDFARRETRASRLSHIVPLVVAALLLWLPRLPLPVLDVRFLPRTAGAFWVGAAMTAAGLAFAVWARTHLGRNWSGVVTIKVEHELVTSGPYRIVRHPIYTGLLLAFLGSAVAQGQWRGLLAIAWVSVALWRKLRLEETWMLEQFGQRYETYRARATALVPFLL